MFDSLDVAVLIQDNTGMILAANQAVKRVFGLSEEELLGHTLTNFGWKCVQEDGADLPSDKHPLNIALRTGKPVTNVIIGINTTGSDNYKWLKINAYPEFPNSEKKPFRAFAFISEILEDNRSVQSIKESEEKFRLIAINSVDTIWTMDTRLKFTYLSPSLITMMGFKPEEWIGTRISKHSNLREFLKMGKIALKMIREYNTFGHITFESGMYNKKGEMVPIEITGKPLIHNGKLVGLQGVARDITERRKSEFALKENELKLRRIAENISDLVWTTDMNLNLTYISPSVQKILGTSPEEYLKKKIVERYPSDTINKIQSIIKDELKYQAHNKKDLNRSQIIEIEHYKADGSLVCCEMNFKFICGEDGGVPIGLQGVTRDITERKKAEEQMLALASIVEQSNDIIVVKDLKMKVVATNSAFVKAAGRNSIDELIGKTDSEIFNMPPDQEPIKTYIANELQTQRLGTGQFILKEELLYMQNGDILTNQVKKYPIFNSQQQLIGSGTISVDITERKKAEADLILAKEKAQESDRLKTAFIQNITHEIRTPLNGILGFSQFLMESKLSEDERQEYYQYLETSCNRLVQTVNDFMDISKIATGAMEVTINNFLVDELLDELLYFTTQLCSKKDIKVNLILQQGNSGLYLNSDMELLRRALKHLLSNAEKFTQKGSISFGYKIEKNLPIFFVNDTGVGISKDKIPLMFNYFMQEDTSLTRGYEGSGLGLSITKGIITLLGGDIWVESEKNVGSTFYFTVPKLDSKSGTRKFTFTSWNKCKDESPCILIAEDNETNYYYLKLLLEKEGYTTLHAENGADAVELCMYHPEVNLVLMDIKMPIMNGIEATQEIKKFRQDLPIIAITAYARNGDDHKILEAGCDDILPKPLDKKRLFDMLSIMFH